MQTHHQKSPRWMTGVNRIFGFSAGFSLLEVLVSIIILSVGLLGMVGLQAYSLKANREARLQSSGVALVRDLAEMVRGNRSSGTGNPYLVDTSHPLVSAAPDDCLSVGSYCATTDAIGHAEMTEWLARVDDELPAARVVVCLDDSPYDGAGLPRWPCAATGTTSPMVVKIGWTRASFNRLGVIGGATMDRATRPAVVLSLAPGSTAP